MKRFYSLLIAFIVAISASMAAHTQLFLVGGFSGWGFSPENELSTTDGDYYVATYPTGSEIELSGDFKLADPTWNILNYGGNLQVEAGKSYTLVKGAGNLNAVGKIKITKIEFTVSTATLKIIGTTSKNLFDLSKDQGVSLAEFSDANGEKFVSKLSFKGNGVYTGTYTVPNYKFYLKVGGDGNFNTIDFGWNGNYIVLGESYILKKGEMQFAAVYPEEGDWKAGDVFDVQVTFTADWTATLLLTKKAVTPEPDPEPDPEPEPEPDPYPEYPILGYLYIVDCENDRYDEIAKYEPISNSDVEYFLVPEKLEQKIYGYDIYKFEVRNPEGIRVWNKDDVFNSAFSGWYTFDEYEGVDISKTPCYANEVWYESIEDMATWRVVYEFDNYDEAVIEKMQADSTGVLVATFEAVEEGDWGDGFYFCLGDKDDPIMELGLTNLGNFLDENQLQIPQGFKVNIYLDDSNWETEFKYYYELLPLGDPWNKGYIDLGLTSGLCWATTNLGATEPEGEGLHFAWGEIEPKDNYSYRTYKWANLLEDNEYIKYVTKDRYGFVDFRTTLDPSDDAANEALTSKWHIPTLQDAEELLRECTVENLEYKGVKGYYIKGPNGNVIFLPAVGKMVGETYEDCTDCGVYWTSTLHEDYQDQANVLFFNYAWSLEVDKNPRVEGLPIRPVIHKDFVAIDEVPAIDVYAKDGTIYSELDFEIYNLTGINVTHLNGSLEGIYIVKTNEGNRLISVW